MFSSEDSDESLSSKRIEETSILLPNKPESPSSRNDRLVNVIKDRADCLIGERRDSPFEGIN